MSSFNIKAGETYYLVNKHTNEYYPILIKEVVKNTYDSLAFYYIRDVDDEIPYIYTYIDSAIRDGIGTKVHLCKTIYAAENYTNHLKNEKRVMDYFSNYESGSLLPDQLRAILDIIN